MSKYNMGDKIKFIFSEPYENLTLGKIYTILCVYSRNPTIASQYHITGDNGNEVVFWETSELERDGFEPYEQKDINFLELLKGY